MIKIFLKMKEQYIKTEMEYRANFFMMMLSGVITKLFTIAIPFVIYQNIPNIAGWRVEEIYLIMAYLFIAEGLCSVLFNGIWEIPSMVFTGSFDQILTRPISPLYQVLSYGMGLQGISTFAFGMVAMVVCLLSLQLFCLKNLLLSLLFIVCGTLICGSVYLIGNSIIFWFDSGGHTSIPYLISTMGQYARYPIEIYTKGVQFLLTFVIPYAFICVIPVEILRGEHGLVYLLGLLGMTVLFLWLSRMVFYRGIRHYESVGM